MDSLNCRIAEVKLKDKEILFINIEPNQEFHIFDCLDLKAAAFELGKGQKFYNIIKVGEHTLPSKEAREFSSSEEGCEFKKADAFVIKSRTHKIMANLILKVNKPLVPTSFFSTMKEAEIWIDSLIHSKASLSE